MSENHPDGYLKYQRKTIGYRNPKGRTTDYKEIYAPEWSEDQLSQQGQRCMDCGVPTCMGGCPIGNLIPEWNDIVYRKNWHQALERLHATNNFPEFTGYTCPAPCEPACTLAYNDQPVTIKDMERAIVDMGWKNEWIIPQPPKVRTDKKVAIVGSGPAGLAAAQQLNRAGHNVTVLERDDEIGGLMMYGIPDFKFGKYQVQRRVKQLKAEGIQFKTNVNVGTDITLEQLRKDYDAVLLAIGVQSPREVPIPGRNLKGIHYAMDFLTQENKHQAGKPVENQISAKGKHVVVLGGGDTGADCVATAHRQGAKDVVQISINPKLPESRIDDNPWPLQPLTYKKTYAIEEGGQEEFSINTEEFVDQNGDGAVDAIRADHVEWEYDSHRKRVGKHVIKPDLMIPADLILIAIGFAGAESKALGAGNLRMTDRGVFQVDKTMMTTVPGVFAAGDARRGASLVVWAIGEGRDAARYIDIYLTGESDLPASLFTRNSPTEP